MGNTLVKKSLLGVRFSTRYARDENAGNGGGAGSGDAGGTDDAGGADTDDDADDDQDDKGAGKADSEKTVSEAKYLQIKKHLSEADRKKAELEAELKALKTKDLPEVEKLRAEHEEAAKAAEKYKVQFQTMARTNAFLTASSDLKIAWANTASALKLAELEDLEINEDGSVDGIKDAVKALAKDHPYLLAPKDSEEDGKSTPPAKSGSVVGSKKKGTKPEGEYTPEELRRRFGALR